MKCSDCGRKVYTKKEKERARRIRRHLLNVLSGYRENEYFCSQAEGVLYLINILKILAACDLVGKSESPQNHKYHAPKQHAAKAIAKRRR
jgi:hypothetical protein